MNDNFTLTLCCCSHAESWHPTSGDSGNSSESVSVGAPSSVPVAKKDPRIGKRKPEPQLDAISDVQERRKQRRLSKNRATAAVSRCACVSCLSLPSTTSSGPLLNSPMCGFT